ncbi:MAG: hypothetical protein WB764_11325 [Xanthobacteraceae bacterium]
MKSFILVVVSCAMAGSAFAQEPVGCDKFKWPLDKERATLNGTDLPKIVSGASVTFPIPFGTIVALVPFADAKLPAPPERTPKSPDSFAGFFEVKAPPQAGGYKITLSAEGWIDVAQSGQAVKSTAFSGAMGCEGIRKSVKFDLAATPFTVELSSIKTNSIKIVISKD